MCMQCAMGAMTAGAAASGTRAWLATRVTPMVLRRATIGLLAMALVLSTTVLGGGG